MYTLYGHFRYFKFMQKYQQYGPCFQTIFPFLMTMKSSCILRRYKEMACKTISKMVAATGLQKLFYSMLTFYNLLLSNCNIAKAAKNVRESVCCY